MSFQSIKNVEYFKLLFSQPEIFWRKLKAKARNIYKEIFIDKRTARFIEHNKKVWRGWADPGSKKVVLVDWHNLPEWHVLGPFFANVLARKKKARICSFARERWRFSRSTHAVHRSFNVTEHVATSKLSMGQRERRDKIYNEAITALKTKEDVFHLKVNGFHIGLDIYEGYLREFSKPTVYMDEMLFSMVRLAVGYLVFWEDYFNKHEVAGVVVSHDCYVDYNIVCRVAYQRNVPVYLLFGAFVSYLKQHNDSKNYFYSYRRWFEEFTAEEKQEAKELARRQLHKRFNGEVGGDLFYMNASAFSSQGNFSRVIRPSNKTKVLICSHCFYDNPHCYGGMIFIDFYEWLKFLAKTAEKTDYDWYLKTHPNPLPGTLEVIKEILGPASRITILPSGISHHQLAQEGIDYVLTVYGTVGHEYPALGVQVINAGYNPHVAYDFTSTPKNLEEYEYFLTNLNNLKKEIKIEEVYEFYYMHYYYHYIDDLFYHSFRGEVLGWTREQSVSPAVYAYYLDGWNEKRHQKSIQYLEEFIDSGKQHLFAKGPVDAKESHPQESVYLS